MGATLSMLAAVLVTATAAPATRDVIPVYVSPNSNMGVDMVEFQWTGAGPGNLAAQMGVFRRPARFSDMLPPYLRQFATFMGPLRAEPQRSRLLLAHGGIRMYAYPTKEGNVCYLVGFGGGSCAPALMHGALPTVEPRRDVFGLLDDKATRVDVSFANVTLRAAVGRNAFYLQLPRGTVVPRSITVTDRDGSRHLYVIERCSPQGLLKSLPGGPLAPPPGC